jgi:oligogalacturonide lyase
MKKAMYLFWLSVFVLIPTLTNAQIGKRFPSEKKVVKEPVMGTELIF